MSTILPEMRGKPGPRWSVVNWAASVLEPALISGLFTAGRWVRVGPPLLASGPSRRLPAGRRLLPLPAARAKPALDPTALKLTRVVVWALARMSGAEPPGLL